MWSVDFSKSRWGTFHRKQVRSRFNALPILISSVDYRTRDFLKINKVYYIIIIDIIKYRDNTRYREDAQAILVWQMRCFGAWLLSRLIVEANVLVPFIKGDYLVISSAKTRLAYIKNGLHRFCSEHPPVSILAIVAIEITCCESELMAV